MIILWREVLNQVFFSYFLSYHKKKLDSEILEWLDSDDFLLVCSLAGVDSDTALTFFRKTPSHD